MADRKKFKLEDVPLEAPTGWRKIDPARCDLCGKVATWKHPSRGLRCNTCHDQEKQP